MYKPVTGKTADPEHHSRTDIRHFSCKLAYCQSCHFCSRAFPKERSKSRGSRLSIQMSRIKIYEKCFLCHSVVLCKTCNMCPKCCPKSNCRGPASKIFENLAGVQGTAFWSVHSTLGVHCDSKRGETDGHTQGYKDPPVPRRLVGESHIPPGLSPAYSKTSGNMPTVRLAGEFGQVGAGSKTDLRFCRIPVRPRGRSGPTDPRPVAEPPRQNR